MDGIKSLIKSRKFVLVLAALGVVAAFVLTGKLPAEQAPTLVVVLAGALVVAIAHEDAGKGGGAPPDAPAT